MVTAEKAYKYDSETKEFLNEILVMKDPLNETEYLMPDNCTFENPPQAENEQVACFINGNWNIFMDHREHYQVKLEDITFSKLGYIGEAHEGYQFITDEVFEDYSKDNEKYKVIDGEFIDISDTEEYQEILRQRELYRISQLQCTKRVFVEIIEKAFNIDYFDDIEPLINENKQAKKEWLLCVELKRENPLLDSMAARLNITPEQLNQVFKYANGEITQEELIGG